jgi:hypothetical protein
VSRPDEDQRLRERPADYLSRKEDACRDSPTFAVAETDAVTVASGILHQAMAQLRKPAGNDSALSSHSDQAYGSSHQCELFLDLPHYTLKFS